MQPMYFDYAAATPIDEGVLKRMQPYFSQQFYNPSGLSLASRRIKEDIKQARAQVARVIGAKPAEVIFTAGGTEANNIALHGVMRNYPQSKVVISAIEHHAVLKPSEQYSQAQASVNSKGIVNVKDIEENIDDRTVLVSIMYVNNEVGTVQPLREVASVIERVRSKRIASGVSLPLYFHTDACQAANYLSLDVDLLGVDLMTLNGGKIYGPKQSGCLYVRHGVVLAPFMLGGGQEKGIRSGTESVANIIGFSAALHKAQKNRKQEADRLSSIQQFAYNELTKNITNIHINGHLKKRICNNVHLTIPGTDNERMLMELDERGIIAAAGSACKASNDNTSHVLKAMGVSKANAQTSIRLSFGRHTTKEQVSQLVTVLKEVVSST